MTASWGSLSNFTQRAVLGILSATVLAIAVLFSHEPPLQYLFPILLAGAQAVALWEYYNLAKVKLQNSFTIPFLAITFSTIYMIVHYLGCICPHCSSYSEPLLYLFGVTTLISYFRRYEHSIVNVAITFFGFLYVTFPLSLLLDLDYRFVNSPLWLVYLITATKTCDTAAYFGGKKYGSRQIAPVLSPKKTIEGAIAGLIGALFVGVCFFFFVTPLVTLLEMLLLSFAIGAATILGDLAESLFKRDAGVKDSNTMPGFGGVLDMVDSTLFTAPLLYVYLRMKFFI